MALLHRPRTPARGRAAVDSAERVSRETARPAPTRGPWPGMALAVGGAALAWSVHRLLPAVPMLTAAVAGGIALAHVPALRPWLRSAARPGLSLAARRPMRIGIVLLGLGLGLDQVARLGWGTVAMVVGVVVATFLGTLWLGRRLGLRGDQPLLIATGYAICGASAIGAVSEVSDSEEEDVAASVALVTLCGTLAIVVLPLLQGPLGLDAPEFGRWVGASVHDVGQVVAAAQTAGPEALGEAVVVKLMRVALLAPLVALVALSVRRSRRVRRTVSGRRPPLVPLFVLGFLAAVALRATGLLPAELLTGARTAQELLLAAALFALGSAVHLPTLSRTGARAALLGLAAWLVIAGAAYGGVLLTT
ncbi:YeiH family protein [Streptomyces sp. BI20]|uniref:YeiH family protein n=1 Tax=Streptomyces sp. BI20 TaxID=3403460 RepID=UPI003C791BE4